MANIALTATCNRACSFCFATDAMEAHAPGSQYMTLEKFDTALEFLIRSNIPEARLLGGEPTIHPDFERIVDRVLARGLRLMVFSGGMIPEKALRRLEEVPAGQLTVLLNVIPPASGKPPQLLRQAFGGGIEGQVMIARRRAAVDDHAASDMQRNFGTDQMGFAGEDRMRLDRGAKIFVEQGVERSFDMAAQCIAHIDLLAGNRQVHGRKPTQA